MSVDRDELRAKAGEGGWVLAFSGPTLDQYTLTPAGEGRAKREVAVDFSAAGIIIGGYETYLVEKGRFLGRPIAAEHVLAAISGTARETESAPAMAPEQ
jgi:hypothetical protein